MYFHKEMSREVELRRLQGTPTRVDLAISFAPAIAVLFVKSIMITIYVLCISQRRYIKDQFKDQQNFDHTVLEDIKSKRTLKSRK